MARITAAVCSLVSAGVMEQLDLAVPRVRGSVLGAQGIGGALELIRHFGDAVQEPHLGQVPSEIDDRL